MAETTVVQCPKCSAQIQIQGNATAQTVQCVKCQATISILPVARAAALVKLGFLLYWLQHFAATHGPAAFGISCGILAIPIVSLLKPAIGYGGMYYVLIGAVLFSVLTGAVFTARRLLAYFLRGERAVSDDAKSWAARLAYGGLTFLIPIIPWVGVEYFSPSHGLMATIIPHLRKEQALWFHMTSPKNA